MRHHLRPAALAAALALAAAMPARADYTVQDASHQPQTIRSVIANGIHHAVSILEVLVGGAPTQVTGDGTGAGVDVHVRDSALPAGAATSAGQATNGAKLDQLHTDVTAGTTQAATNGGKLDTLHTDVSTTVHGDLSTANSNLSQLHTDVTAGTTQAATNGGKLDTLHTDVGTTLHGDVTSSNSKLDQLHTDNGAGGTGITPPSGGSGIFGWLSGIFSNTSANHSDLQQVHTDLTGGGQKAQIASNAPNITASGTLTALNDAVSLTPAGLAGLGLEVTGTNSGGVITPECEVSGVWQTINIIPLGGGPKATTISVAGSWESIAGGVTQCRLRLSTAGSGSFGVTLVATNGSRLVRAFNTDPSNFYATVSDGQNATNTNTISCTLNSSTTTCGPFTPTAKEFHVSWAPTAFTASCQVERKADGTNWSEDTVTAGGSTTQMYNWAFSSSSQAISEDLSEPQQNVPYQIHCTTTPSGSAAVKFSH